ncbi:MAG: ATP-binding protein [Candidatus Aenigmarchaeota archaeon]|nr:ATP-binding protein [Candidatus Aenigmarchaeota archaeon]
MLLGKISGRVTTAGFSFDAEARVKKMQYVTVKDSEGHWVLGYIDSLVRYGTETVAKVVVIGYRDSRGFLKTPNAPFSPDTPIFAADSEMIKNTIGLKEDGAYIGLLDDYDIKVLLPIKHLITKHVSVLAKTGAGKSYAAGVLIEELAENKVPAVIIDPHGEYSAMVEKNSNQKEVELMDRFSIEPKGYEEQVQVYSISDQANQLKLNSKLTMSELLDILPRRPSASQQGLLYNALSKFKSKDFTIRDIIDEVNENDVKYKWGLLSLLGSIDETKLFSPVYTKMTEIVQKGKITIIDLKNAKPEIQGMVVMKLTEELFRARKKETIPPFFLVVEEAHNFCPERGFGEVPSSRVLRTIAAEGRKFGMGLCIISQRPAKVDKNVLSQCNTQIILKVTNPNDLKAIIDSVEGVGGTTKEQIKELPIGQAMVVGITDQPLVVSIRIKRSEHGGESIKASKKMKGVSKKFDVFSMTFYEDDLYSKFKGIEDMKLIYYPMWEVIGSDGTKNTPFYVDGIEGELIYEEGEEMKHTKGLMKLLSLPPMQRLVLLYLFKNRKTTIEKMTDELKIPKESIKSSVHELLTNKKLKMQTGEVSIDMDMGSIPLEITDASVGKKRSKIDQIDSKLDFRVSSDYLKKVGELWGVSVTDSRQVFYPYWAVTTHNGQSTLIDAVKGNIDMEKAKLVSKLL